MKYEKPEMSLFEYEEEDVIRTSGLEDSVIENPDDNIEI